MKNYNLGQVVYLCDKDTSRITEGRVVDIRCGSYGKKLIYTYLIQSDVYYNEVMWINHEEIFTSRRKFIRALIKQTKKMIKATKKTVELYRIDMNSEPVGSDRYVSYKYTLDRAIENQVILEIQLDKVKRQR